MNGCTIIAQNYLAHARVLATTYLAHHPGATFTTLVIDDTGDEPRGDEPFESLSPYEIGIDRDELHRMAAIYDVKEFATAVKPALLRTLLQRDESPVAYLDPDIQIFRPLDDIDALARTHGIVLTPHTTAALPRDGLLPSEEMIMRAGIYNLGFIAVGRDAFPFLDWWSERLARNCLVAIEDGIFVDQRWIDFVPALFDHNILTDPTCNVAYWNLTHRRLTRANGSWEVNGEPLRFFHFSGYNPDRGSVLSSHMGSRPRIALENAPAVRSICDEYGALLRAHGFGSTSAPYRFDRLPDGRPIDGPTRRIVRSALLAAERRGENPPPDPFEPGSTEAFLRWLEAPIPPSRLPRYLVALRDMRADLRAAFPDIGRGGAMMYRSWYAAAAQRGEIALPSVLTFRGADESPPTLGSRLEDRLRAASGAHPALARLKPVYKRGRSIVRRARARPTSHVPPGPASDRPGVNVAGYLRAELGVGEAARRLVRALDSAGVPHATYAYGRTVSRQLHPYEGRGERADVYDVNVVCVNADELPNFRSDVGAGFFEDRCTVGLWFWEVSRFPSAFDASFELVDEVWVASDFVRDAVAAATTKPVVTIALPIEPIEPVERSRTELGLPERFLFLFSFDYLSVFERKNPLGLVEAFTTAFGPDEGPVLAIKTINSDFDPEARARLEDRVRERPDIIMVDGYLDADRRDSLMAACDCYVSLHRSEGYGLTMAEALALGKPVVATGYSGNLSFMDESNSYLVPYVEVAIPAGCGPYPPGGVWAEPDVSAAAALLRAVWQRPDEARARAERGRADLTRRLSPEATGAAMAERLELIRERRRVSRVQQAARPMPGHALVEGPVATPTSIARRLLRRLLWPELIARAAREQEIEASVAAVQRTLESVSGEARTVAELVTAATESLHAELDAHRAELDLAPTPYVADEELVLVRDERGETVYGYDAAPPTCAPYRLFEDVFRGPEAFIRARQQFYVPLLAEHAPVLDAGCGRGELLELLRATDVRAQGVDADEAMVARCREKGLDVALGDLTTFLRDLEERSLGSVFAGHVIEHLPYDELMGFFALTKRALRPGGLLVAETVNPHSFPAFKMFWIDPTHRGPIYPEVAVTLCRMHGYDSARVVFPNGVGDLERDRRVQGEYAVIAETR